MRMWMVPPSTMCDKHLLGEHAEIHMLAGNLARRRSIQGFISKGLLEPASMRERHEALVAEMEQRGFKHRSALREFGREHLSPEVIEAHVDVAAAAEELAARCERCRRAQSDAVGPPPEGRE